MGGGSSSAEWDRYVPTPPPGSDKDEGERVQRAAAERNNDQETKKTETDKQSVNNAKTETPDRSKARTKEQPKSDKNNKAVAQKDKDDEKTNRHGKAQIKSYVDRNANNAGTQHKTTPKKPVHSQEGLKKEKEYVSVQFLGEVDKGNSSQNISSGSRWRMKIIPSKQFTGNRSNNKSKSEEFSDKDALSKYESFPTGPVTKPRMKIGHEYMLEKQSQCEFSPNGDFVLDRRTGVT